MLKFMLEPVQNYPIVNVYTTGNGGGIRNFASEGGWRPAPLGLENPTAQKHLQIHLNPSVSAIFTPLFHSLLLSRTFPIEYRVS